MAAVNYNHIDVEIDCGAEKKVYRRPDQKVLEKACPYLVDRIQTKIADNSSDPIRVDVDSIETFDYAINACSHAPLDLLLDESALIKLLDFALQCNSTRVQEAVVSQCLTLHFDQLLAKNLTNYHSSLLKCGFWRRNGEKEDKLFEAISRQGSEVLDHLSASKRMCFKTVKKILEQKQLNVFNEKQIFDSINEWRNNIKHEYGKNDVYDAFEHIWKEELLPLIRFEFFSIKDANEFLDEQTSPLRFEEKMTLLQRTPSQNTGLDRDLDLVYWSQWRGDFIPFTERTMLLKPEEDRSKWTWNSLNITPLQSDLYLLSIRLYNLKPILGHIKRTKLSLLIEVIREDQEDDETTVSKTSREWNYGQSKNIMLGNPCLLEKDRKYKVKVTYLQCKLVNTPSYQPACDGQEYGDILKVGGAGNICGLNIAFTKRSVCENKKSGT